MANTIRAAKNTFGGGLVMDLAPDTTPNEVLTSALNATLVTFNGNELQLQNDMGNGRVETARLPEGYIPVGTCEFGDIIYIVSYNPLTNRSQIGCFPSPERNISSEEVGSTGQVLQSSDFQVGQVSNGKFVPNGELKANSVKKILYNNKLNPGDKFIIYDTDNTIFLSEQNITDIGNKSHTYGTFPKLLRIHVIAIEDSGKINFLDSTVRWYDDHDYFIRNSKAESGTKKADIDAYRNLLSSGYSVFQSKISGKLALLIELEKITGFSCSYNIYGGGEVLDGDMTYKNYKVYWNVSWETEDPNINPQYVVLTKSCWAGKQAGKEGKWYKYARVGNQSGIELVEGGTSIDIEDAFYDNDGNIRENYKYWNLSGSIDTSNFEDFIETESYQNILKNFLNEQSETFGDSPLTKVNVYKTDSGSYKLIPVPGYYYINATKLVKNESTEEMEGIIQVPNTGAEISVPKKQISDILVNNYFNSVIYLEGQEFSIPFKQAMPDRSVVGVTYDVKPDITNLVYNYEIAPAMPYGILQEYAVNGYIDFSKVGTGEIGINVWKYFVGENVATLTLGMDAYVEENMGISEVVLEFYDNQGMAGAYYINNKASYSGQFTETIPLNGVTNTYKLKNVDSEGNIWYHCGEPAYEQYENVVTFVTDPETHKQEVKPVAWSSSQSTYLDDCGTLYNNMLYLVKIVVKYCPVNALGEFDTTDTTNYRYFYRWMWTNAIFNEQYYHIQDFDDLDLALTLDVTPEYQTTDNYYFKNVKYESPNTAVLDKGENAYNFLSANVSVLTCASEVTVAEDEEGGEGPGGGGSGGGGGTAPESEPELDPSEIQVYLQISQGVIQSITIYSNRTIQSVIASKLHVQVGEGMFYQYTVQGNQGDSTIVVFPTHEIPSNSAIIVSGEQGMFTYGNGQISPAFSTLAE